MADNNRFGSTSDSKASSTLATIENIKNELRVDSKGVGYVSIRGAARICGVDFESIRKSISGDDFLRTKLGKKLTQYGFKGDDFLNGISDVALSPHRQNSSKLAAFLTQQGLSPIGYYQTGVQVK